MLPNKNMKINKDHIILISNLFDLNGLNDEADKISFIDFLLSLFKIAEFLFY